MAEACVEALCEHLKRIGLNATVESKKSKWREVLQVFYPLSFFILGSVRVVNRNIDFVELGETRGELSYFRCNYVVQAKVNGPEDRLKAKGKPVRKSFLSGQAIDFKWKGGELAQVLNGDANLRDKLYRITSGLLWEAPYVPLETKPDKKHQRVKIRTSYPRREGLEAAFPTLEEFEVYDRVAQQIRSIANVRP